jgi:hypothetical protein
MQSIPTHPTMRGTASTLLWPSSCNTGRLQRMQSSSWTWAKSMSRRLTRHATTFHSTTAVGPIYYMPPIFQNSRWSSPWSTNGGSRIVCPTTTKTVIQHHTRQGNPAVLLNSISLLIPPLTLVRSNTFGQTRLGMLSTFLSRHRLSCGLEGAMCIFRIIIEHSPQLTHLLGPMCRVCQSKHNRM